MDIEAVKHFCRSFPSCEEKETPPPYSILTYSVAGKKFAYFKTSTPEQWRFSFRTSPERFLELTDQPGVKPARYMQRFHWVSIVNVAAFDPDYLQELVHWSYQKAFSALPKKTQKSITG